MTPSPSPSSPAKAPSQRAERQLDTILDAWMAPPEGLARRVCLRCHEYAGEEAFLWPARPSRRPFPWGAAVASLAACLCLMASLGTYLGLKGQADSASSLARANSLPSLEAEEAAPAMPMAAMAPQSSSFAARSREIPLAEGLTASRSLGFSFLDDLALRVRRTNLPPQHLTAASNGGRFSGDAAGARPLPAPEQKVTHVWIASRHFSPEKLEDFLKRNPVLSKGSASPDEHGVYTVSLLAMDTEIQHTVDTLFEKLHWKLLSPESPQPGQGGNTPVAGRPIHYAMKILPQKE